VGRPEGKNHFEDQVVGGKIGSEWIFGKLAWGARIGFNWLRTGTGGGAVASAVMNLRFLVPRN
jgi:hypothetical protein